MCLEDHLGENEFTRISYMMWQMISNKLSKLIYLKNYDKRKRLLQNEFFHKKSILETRSMFMKT